MLDVGLGRLDVGLGCLKVGFWWNFALLVVIPRIISVPGIAGLFYLCLKDRLMTLIYNEEK